MAYVKSPGLVLKNANYKEADKLLTIYTREQGKVPAIAKGVRKVKSSMRGGIQLFSHTDFVFYRGRSLDTVTQCAVIEPFVELRSDLDRFAYAAYMAELIVESVPEREANSELFLLLLTCLHLLITDDPQLVIRLFEVRLMNILGYAPQLDGCVSCGSTQMDGAKLGLREGGLVCRHCAVGGELLMPVTAGALANMKALSTMELDKCGRLRLSPALQGELSRIMGRYIEVQLERRFKSRAFLESLTGV